MNKHVTLYSTTMCPVCGMVRDLLNEFSIEYEEIFVDLRPIVRLKLTAKTHKLSVPQLKIGEEWVFGFDPIRTLELLRTVGEETESSEAADSVKKMTNNK